MQGREKYVYAKLDRTGLCNKLFPWARAVVYAYENGLSIIAPKWTDLMRIGPWLRRERDKRYYFNEFTNNGYVGRLSGLRTNPIALRLMGTKVFSGMDGFFDSFVEKQDLIKNELRRIANLRLLENADALRQSEFIAVHVRRGDFVANGQWIPDDWYVRAVEYARRVFGGLPVRIFSDGNPRNLAPLINQIGDAQLMPPAPALQDLFSLSYSKALVCTANSTFSMWGVFLGQMPSIWPKDFAPPRMYVDKDMTIQI